jgi:lantibiotic modifying enzyme
MNSRTWTPVLRDDLSAAALAAVEAIAADLVFLKSLISPFGPDPEFSLARGTAGQALFFAYLDEALPGRGYRAMAMDLLAQAVETAATRPAGSGLFEGLEGVEWVLEHLKGRSFGGAVRLAGAWETEAGEVEDAGLCRGAAGIAHRLDRRARETGEERIAEEARCWFARLLAMRRPGEGIGGFQARVPDGRGGAAWADDPGFLNGAAGIGLALLAAISPVEPAWDQVLLGSASPAVDAKLRAYER